MFHDAGPCIAVKLDVFEIQVGARLGQIRGQLDLAGHDGFGTVGAELTLDGETGNRLGRTHGIRFLAVSQVVIAAGDDRRLEFIGGRDDRRRALLRLGPGVDGTTGGTVVEEGDLIFRGRSKTVYGCGSSGSIRFGEFLLNPLSALDGSGLDVGNFLEIRHLLAPLKRNGGFRTVQDFQEKVVLHRIGLDIAVIDRPQGRLTGIGERLNLEIILLIGGQVHGIRDIDGLHVDVQDLVGHGLVVIDNEVVSIGILVDIPTEGDIVPGRGIDPGGKVLRLQAALQGKFGNFFELL